MPGLARTFSIVASLLIYGAACLSAQCSPSIEELSRTVALAPSMAGEIEAPDDRLLNEIRNAPTIIFNRTEYSELEEGEFLVSEAAVHAAYPVPMEFLYRAIVDVDEHASFMPSVTQSSAVCGGGSGDSGGSGEREVDPIRQHITTSFGFLFFRATYDNVVDIYVRRDPQRRSALIWHTLHESLDGKLQELGGLWYLEEERLEGQTVTYIQRRSRTVFSEEPVGLRAALNAFSSNQLKKLLDAVRDEGRRRQRVR